MTTTTITTKIIKNKNQDGWPSRGDEWKDRVLQLMVYPRSPEPNQQSLFGGSEGQSFHYGSLSTVAAADRQSSQLGRPLRNVFLPASSQSATNLYKTRYSSPPLTPITCESYVNFQFSTFFLTSPRHQTHHSILYSRLQRNIYYIVYVIPICVFVFTNLTHIRMSV